MIVVTGGAGFIGSNLVRALNDRGVNDVVVVDDLSDGRKFTNLVDCDIEDFWDMSTMTARLAALAEKPRAVLHQGACAVTTEWNGRFMMEVNYQFSVDVLAYCLKHSVPLIYASSAAVYGVSSVFDEDERSAERPLNVYGYSKLLFDCYVRRLLSSATSQVVGLRYFNVYGPREAHKGSMASVVYHFDKQLQESGKLRLFEGSAGYADGEQRRDFVYVEDVVKVNLWFLDNVETSGIFNVGTGRSASFNELARAVIDWHGRGVVEYVPFPETLRASYQSFTEADIGALRRAGYSATFMDVRKGTAAYLETCHGHR